MQNNKRGQIKHKPKQTHITKKQTQQQSNQ